MRRLVRLIALVTALASLPSAAFAQATAAIAGVVKDTSGAVLPGVTVEASSPALIEKVRTAVSDGNGQYRIPDLRPGVYAVTFSLTGFSTVRREGIEIAGSFVANINADMQVGALEETITVTSAAPVVDVSSVKQQSVMTQEVLTSIPTGRAYQNLHVLVPGVTTNAVQDVGGTGGDVQVNYTIHGGQYIDSRNLIDGMSVAAPESNGGRTMFVPDVGMAQEVTITTSQALGESDGAGVTVNVIPREGGNTIKGMIFGTFANESMAADNYDPAFAAQGLRAANRVYKNFDIDGGIGLPLIKDRLWLFATTRWHGVDNYVAGMYKDLNAGKVNAWTYAPSDEQVIFDSRWLSASGRMTIQATPRNKINLYYEDQVRCVGCNASGTATNTAEAQARSQAHPLTLGQVSWNSPVTNRVLLEAGMGGFAHRWGTQPFHDTVENAALIRVTDQAGAIPGLSYKSANYSYNWTATYSSRASLTYTTGTHNAKFGYNGTFYNRNPRNYNNSSVNYRFSNGTPNQITEFLYPLTFRTHMNLFGLYAQDQWNRGRLTLQGGVRYDNLTNSFPEAVVGPNRFLSVATVIPEAKGADVNDITPRMAASYDVFGNGKTALKFNIGKYVVSQDNTASPLGNSLAPISQLATSTTRTWTDTNGNFNPDCDLTNGAAQNLTASGGDVCAAIANQSFGTPRYVTRIDEDLRTGWGVRPYTWSLETAVQHEILTGVSVTAGYFRRWLGNFVVTDNLANAASDFTLVNLPMPADSRLPGGVVNGVPDINPNVFGAENNLITAADGYGNVSSTWNGMDLSVNARRKGVLFQGGMSTGRSSQDQCEVMAKLPELQFSGAVVTPFLNSTYFPVAAGTTVTPLQYCKVDGKFLTQFKFLGAYTLPKIDVQLSGTFQALPGVEQQATYNAPNSVMAPLLGRNLSAGVNSNVAVNLLEPGSLYGDRINQLDFRVAKIFRMSARRVQVSLDLYNALNSNVVQTYNNAFIPNGAWLRPTAILSSRLAKITAQLDF